MRIAYLLAAVASCSLTMPLEAKPDGKGQAKREQIGGKKAGGKSSYERTRRTSADRTRTRDGRHANTRYDRNRDGVRDDTYARGERACPPGLAKKNNGCLPPGQAKKKFAVGQRLPSSYNSYNLPEQYRDDYRDNAEDLFRYNDGTVYRVDRRTRLIEEVIGLLGR